MSANHSYLKDRLGFDPDDFATEVDELFNITPDDEDLATPSHKRFKAFTPSPSSSVSSIKDYENALNNVKGKQVR